MADQSITCTACGKKIRLTRALRADIQESLRSDFERQLETRERELRDGFDADLQRVQNEARRSVERQLGLEIRTLQGQLAEQSSALADMRQQELALRKRERELESERQALELEIARQLDQERRRIVDETRARLLDEHHLKDVEKDRQLADMRRQIEVLKRRAEQGSQQRQGEAGEGELESVLAECCRQDQIEPVSHGVRGGDIHQVIFDTRGIRVGTILWECKNTRNWSDVWIPKLKMDQRAVQADVAVLVSACLPKGVARFAYIDGVLVTDFASVPGIVAILRAQLTAVAQARRAATHKEERLELLHRYLTGTAFRHRVEAVVDAFTAMRQDLEQERRAAERLWARRARQLEAVTLNVSGMYGDLQGLVPALPSIGLLDPPDGEADEARSA